MRRPGQNFKLQTPNSTVSHRRRAKAEDAAGFNVQSGQRQRPCGASFPACRFGRLSSRPFPDSGLESPENRQTGMSAPRYASWPTNRPDRNLNHFIIGAPAGCRLIRDRRSKDSIPTVPVPGGMDGLSRLPAGAPRDSWPASPSGGKAPASTTSAGRSKSGAWYLFGTWNLESGFSRARQRRGAQAAGLSVPAARRNDFGVLLPISSLKDYRNPRAPKCRAGRQTQQAGGLCSPFRSIARCCDSGESRSAFGTRLSRTTASSVSKPAHKPI